MSRALATIQTIKALSPIEGADRIETATFENIGWTTVVKKGEFKPGDLCVFFEIDSIVSDLPAFAFLGDKKRIRTQKLRGALSQGLALPLSAFGDVIYDAQSNNWTQEVEPEDGDNLTTALGVTEYVPPTKQFNGTNKSKGDFPTYLGVSKTDETRIQAVPSVLDELKGHPYYITTKLDGTSATYAWDRVKGEFLICSRNNILDPEGDSVYHRMAERYGLCEALRANPRYVLQGEICGPSIQGNKLGLPEADLFVFNAFDQDAQAYLGYEEILEARLLLGFRLVPWVAIGTDFTYTLPELLDLAEGFYNGTQNQREGIVVRPQVPMHSEKLRGPLSFKVISNAFLLGNPSE